MKGTSGDPGRRSGLVFEVANFSVTSQNAYLAGAYFEDLDRFGPVWVNLDHFLGLIFLFLSFFQF